MKKLMVLAAIAAMAFGATAEGDASYQYLYWQVDESRVASGIGSYNAAMFCRLDGDGTVELSRIETAAGGRWSGPDNPAATMTDFSGYGVGDSFVFELAMWNGTSLETVGTSATFSYAQLADYLTQWQGGASTTPTQGVFTPSFAVPEPTSGLLMLIGLAGLALRRKQA